MATQISPVIFEEDEIVGFKDKICIIKAIRQAKLGYHLFELTDIDTQATYVSFKHQLSKAVTLPEFDVPADADEMVDVDSHDWVLDVTVENGIAGVVTSSGDTDRPISTCTNSIASNMNKNYNTLCGILALSL